MIFSFLDTLRATHLFVEVVLLIPNSAIHEPDLCPNALGTLVDDLLCGTVHALDAIVQRELSVADTVAIADPVWPVPRIFQIVIVLVMCCAVR